MTAKSLNIGSTRENIRTMMKRNREAGGLHRNSSRMMRSKAEVCQGDSHAA